MNHFKKTIGAFLFFSVVTSVFANTDSRRPTLAAPDKPTVVFSNPSVTPVWPDEPEEIKKMTDLATYPEPLNGTSFYEQEKEHANALRALEYRESVLKLQNSILKLSLAAQVQQRMLNNGGEDDAPSPAADNKKKKTPEPVETPIRLIALFMKDNQKSAELEWNGDSQLVQEGGHIGDYLVQKINSTGVLLSDSENKATFLALE